jgi:hypothetical protein
VTLIGTSREWDNIVYEFSKMGAVEKLGFKQTDASVGFRKQNGLLTWS